MFKGLLIDCIAHYRECIILNASLFVSAIAAATCFRRSRRKTDDRIKAFILLAAVSFAMLMIPVSASIIRIVFGTYYDVPDIWGIIPLIPLGAVCVSAMAGEFVSDMRREKKSTLVTGFALIAGAVLLCGSLGTSVEQSEGRYENASLSEREVAEFICTNYEGCTVLANDDITACIHGISAEVTTLYGRDMWDGRLTKNRYGTYPAEVRDLRDDLLNMEDKKYYLAPEVAKDAFAMGAGIVVVPGECDPAVIEGAGYPCEEFTASNGERFYLIHGGIL